jgi:hypothetical protein
MNSTNNGYSNNWQQVATSGNNKRSNTATKAQQQQLAQ